MEIYQTTSVPSESTTLVDIYHLVYFYEIILLTQQFFHHTNAYGAPVLGIYVIFVFVKGHIQLQFEITRRQFCYLTSNLWIFIF